MIFELRLCFFWLTSDHIYIYICVSFVFFKDMFFHFCFQKKTPGVSPFRWVKKAKGPLHLTLHIFDGLFQLNDSNFDSPK